MLRFCVVLSVCVVASLATRRQREIQPQPQQCKLADIEAIDVPLSDLVGTWYLVGHKKLGNFQNISIVTTFEATTGNANQLQEVVYIRENGQCKGPLSSTWTKESDGSLRKDWTSENTLKSFFSKFVYRYNRPHRNEDLLVIFICWVKDADGTCSKSSAGVLSKQRSPSLHAIYSASQHFSKACAKESDFESVSTDTTCGMSADGTQKPLTGAELETTEDICKVANIKGIPYTSLADFDFSATVYTLAYINEFLDDMGTSFISGNVEHSENPAHWKAHFKLISYGVCYEGALDERIDERDVALIHRTGVNAVTGETFSDQYRTIWACKKTGTVVDYNCAKVGADGKCEKVEVSINSKQKSLPIHVMQNIYEVLRKYCVNPRTLKYPNVDATCSNPKPMSEMPKISQSETDENDGDKPCNPEEVKGVPVQLSDLEGTWYAVAASIHGQWTMRSLISKYVTSNDQPNSMDVSVYYEASNGSCLTLQNTRLSLTDANTGKVEFNYRMLSNMVKRTYTIVYMDPSYMVYHTCSAKNADNTCQTAELVLKSRTRYPRTKEISNIMERLVPEGCFAGLNVTNSLKYFNLQSHCGMEVESTFASSHGYLAMSHENAMDIVTKFSKKTCHVRDIPMNPIQPKDLNGRWYSVAYVAPEGMVQSMMVNLFDIGNGNILESTYAHMQTCGHHYALWELESDNRYLVSYHVGEALQRLHIIPVWHNSELFVTYGCAHLRTDGTCADNESHLWIMSRHENVDHAEFMLLEKIVESLCIDPKTLLHTTTHDSCTGDHMSMTGMYDVRKGCNYNDMKGIEIAEDMLVGSHVLVGGYKTNPVNPDVPVQHRAVKYVADAATGHLKVSFNEKINNACQNSTEFDFYKVEGSSSNQWQLVQTKGIVGTSISAKVWHLYDDGIYNIMYGCYSPNDIDCRPDKASLVIGSRYKKMDKVDLYVKLFPKIATVCIDATQISLIDNVHDSCGSHLDAKTCKVDDILRQNVVTEYHGEMIDGAWHLSNSLQPIYDSLTCNYEATSNVNEKKATCNAKIQHRCIGPTVGKLAHSSEHVCHFTYSYTIPSTNHTDQVDLHLLWQNEREMVFYNCMKRNEDGTCRSDRTNVMWWSKNDQITTEMDKAAIKDKLDNVCVLWKNLHVPMGATCDTF